MSNKPGKWVDILLICAYNSDEMYKYISQKTTIID